MEESVLYNLFAYNLRRLISEYGDTYASMARRVEVSRRTLMRWLAGENIPSVIILVRLSLLLNCTIDDFFKPFKE